MRIGNFEINHPLPELRSPHVIVMLRPWLDAGSVGNMVLQRLEKHFGARELARLAKPGTFYDFTRYRPMVYNQSGVRRLTIPTTTLTYARSDKENDFIFLHMLEPHMFGETFTGSVWGILKKLKVQRYCIVGSFYDMVPHTRPISISGGASNPDLQANLKRMKVHQSQYEGPTTICNLISQEAEKAGVEIMTLLAHLPNYAELEEDYVGTMAIMNVLHALYEIPINKSDFELTEAQLKSLDVAVSQDRKIKELVAHLESEYDTEVKTGLESQEPDLSPQVDQFLKEMENRFKNN